MGKGFMSQVDWAYQHLCNICADAIGFTCDWSVRLPPAQCHQQAPLVLNTRGVSAAAVYTCWGRVNCRVSNHGLAYQLTNAIHC